MDKGCLKTVLRQITHSVNIGGSGGGGVGGVGGGGGALLWHTEEWKCLQECVMLRCTNR